MNKKHPKAYYWPQWFYDSLGKNSKTDLKQIIELKKANENIWEALNIYDDIVDGDSGPESLMEANHYYRAYLSFYYSLNLQSNFYQSFESLQSEYEKTDYLEKLETEKTLLNLNNQLLAQRLSKKSLPLLTFLPAVCLLSGYAWPKALEAIKLGRHLLASKQLADDIYDLDEDAAARRTTLATAIANSKKDVLDKKNIYQELADRLNSLISDTKKLASNFGLQTDCPLLKGIIGPLEENAMIKIKP